MPPPPSHPHPPTPPSSTIPLPRILCLHGGGTNASIFHNQLRTILSHPSLSARYRFVFADAPFTCAEGVGVVPVYKDWGPYRRWFRWLGGHEEIDAESARREVLDAVRKAMESDEGSGEWVGVLGFSQGAKVACSLLYQQQLEGRESSWNFQFGVIMAGRCPFAALSTESEEYPWMQSAGGLPSAADLDSIAERPDMRLRVPTVHVHGLKDEGLGLHRRCVEEYCAPGTATVVEWDGPHRIPIKRGDVERVVEGVVGVADEYGV
jgi:predicted esterase